MSSISNKQAGALLRGTHGLTEAVMNGIQGAEEVIASLADVATVSSLPDAELGALNKVLHRVLTDVQAGRLSSDRFITALKGMMDEIKSVSPLVASETKVETTPRTQGQSVRINTDLTPSIPKGWTIEEHKKGGEIELDPSKIVLHLDPAQTSGTIVGNDLRKKLAGKSVLNACALDHFLANPGSIPEHWKHDEQGRTRYIFFWGTIYRDSNGNLFVRSLYWFGAQWLSFCSWLGNPWGVQSPAALLAS